MTRAAARTALLIALVAPLAARAEAPAGPTSYVISPGNEKLFLEMSDPKPGKFAGAWALDAVAIKQAVAVLTYVDGKGGKASLALAHPSAAGNAPARVLGKTDKFALLAEGASAPKMLVDAVAARVRSKESGFSWTALAVETPKGPGPNQGWPTVPDDAVTADRLKRLEYPLPAPDDRVLLDRALAAAKQGKSDAARQDARALMAKHAGALWPQVAGAMLLRASGDGGGAALALAPLVGKGASDAEHDRLRVELAASYELAKQNAEAEKALAGLKKEPDGGKGCGRAQALTLLVQEGRAHDVLQVTAGDLKLQPRCQLQARMRAAIAASDKKALDEAGEAAVKANPRDENLLYLWGSYYYDRMDFQGALKAWDRLAQVNPNYPGFLGLYGTTYHVLGLLKGDVLAKNIARARANADDVLANHLGGIGLYYERKYAEVIPMLEHVLKHNDEPRAGMYLAMSHFFTGDVDGAIKMLDALEPVAHREPDIYYCRSLVWRFYDLPRAIKEMQIFLDVFLNEKRPAYGQQKIEKAKDDLARMKKGEVPSVYLAGQGSYTPPPRKGAK